MTWRRGGAAACLVSARGRRGGAALRTVAHWPARPGGRNRAQLVARAFSSRDCGAGRLSARRADARGASRNTRRSIAGRRAHARLLEPGATSATASEGATHARGPSRAGDCNRSGCCRPAEPERRRECSREIAARQRPLSPQKENAARIAPDGVLAVRRRATRRPRRDPARSPRRPRPGTPSRARDRAPRATAAAAAAARRPGCARGGRTRSPCRPG